MHKLTIVRTNEKLAAEWQRHLAAAAKLKAREYLLEPIVKTYLESFKCLKAIANPADRYEAFRQIPTIEGLLLSLSKDELFSYAQRARARKPRRHLAPGLSVESIVRELCISPEHQEKIAKLLWLPFCERLKLLGLSPRQQTAPGGLDEFIEYEVDGCTRTVGLRRFLNIVSKIRKTLRH